MVKCPSCGEAVQENWKICPACETRLRQPVCPVCGMTVADSWKRCPECEAQLLCAHCQGRIPPGHKGCPRCTAAQRPAAVRGQAVVEDICGIRFLYIPGGTFQMGDTFGEGLDNETPVHTVELEAFFMAATPVTQAQWLRLMPENPSRFPGDDRPVEQVGWEHARQFLGRLETAHNGRFAFCLPTEAQWEYAARSGGKNERFAGGDTVDGLAWYQENSDGCTQPVATLSANGLGLYDMCGNVWEWCRDTFLNEAYRAHTRKNPMVERRGPDRVIRGGAWNLDAWSVRCARRFSLPADYSGAGLGFRPVMAPAS